MSFFNRFYLFIFRERGREGERNREKHLCVTEPSIDCLLLISYLGPGPQPKHVPWLGSNQRLGCLWEVAQPTESYRSGPFYVFCLGICLRSTYCHFFIGFILLQFLCLSSCLVVFLCDLMTLYRDLTLFSFV